MKWTHEIFIPGPDFLFLLLLKYYYMGMRKIGNLQNEPSDNVLHKVLVLVFFNVSESCFLVKSCGTI